MMPMDLVVGDVHHLDILVRRPDGSIATPKIIAWQDVATNRIYCTLILLAPREGVRRIHVAASYASMTASWGLARLLYLDNGSEYNWTEMLDGFAELARIAGDNFTVGIMQEDDALARNIRAVRERAGAVIRARAYNAPAKPIEGLFGTLEGGVLSMLPGWIGGDRMAKKTHNVGREPAPFSGTFADFHQALEVALSYYHSTPQRGWLGGRTPHEALSDAIADGWTATAVSEEAMLLSFASEDTRVVDRGRVSWQGATYYHDNLLAHTGRSIRVRVAPHDPSLLFAFDGSSLIAVARPEVTFNMLDWRGAKEQSRRAGVLRRVIAERRRDCDRLDLVEEMERHVRQAGPGPEIPIGTRVDVAEGDLAQMIERAREADAAREAEQLRGPTRPALKSQWDVDDEEEVEIA